MFSRIRWGCVILEAGVNGQADALATHNVRDFEPATRLFGLRVLLPRDVLKELERWARAPIR